MEVGVDRSGNDPRLLVRDMESGSCAWLDAFVLRSLAMLPAAALEALCRATVPEEAPPGPGAVAGPPEGLPPAGLDRRAPAPAARGGGGAAGPAT